MSDARNHEPSPHFHAEVDDKNKGNDQGDKKNNDTSRKRMRRELTSLHQEMEIAQHGIAKNGNFRRKVPRDQSKVRTKKRKLLEQIDALETVDDNGKEFPERRLRGPKASIYDVVVQDSLIFGMNSESKKLHQGNNQLKIDATKPASRDEAGESDEHLMELDEGGDTEEDEEVDGIDALEDEPNDRNDDDDEEEDDDDISDTNDNDCNELNHEMQINPSKTADATKVTGRKNRRMYRLRNFKSQRLAQKHGAAMGAHALGRQQEAIQLLKQVARDAPSAPQIYSSLGLVYEDMLHECQGKMISNSVATESMGGMSTSETSSTTANIPDKDLEYQLDTAKKAYGSYHIAAILCRRDYTLWLRAADCASAISEIHASMMMVGTIPDSVRTYHREERRRWLEEAKYDYQTADNLQPPGIDVPAKLAFIMIELGLLSDALTLLTDLKRSSKFDSSYRAWLLFSDLMLRIGYQCTQWNRVQNATNFMFRRWLRKLSKSFDWQERRLQGLCKAMEAACGSKICTPLIKWLKNRFCIKSFVTVDRNWNVGTDDLCSDVPGAPSTSAAKLEEERELLQRRNLDELVAFDTTTSELLIGPTTVVAIERNAERIKLQQSHDASMQHLLDEFGDKDGSKELHDDPHITENWEGEMPLSASVTTVCSIASELMRHMLVMQLYEGGQLVGEAVSLYFKERYKLQEKRKKNLKDAAHQSATNSAVLFDAGRYDDNSDEEHEYEMLLSDDEDLNNTDTCGPHWFQKGELPPDLKVLYGLSLACQGGKYFSLGIKCVQAIGLLPREERSWFTEKVIDTSVIQDNSWLLFEQSMKDPLRRTALYAFSSDVILKSRCFRDLSGAVAVLFRNEVLALAKEGVLEKVLDVCLSRNPQQFVQRQNIVVKILVATARFELELLSESMLTKQSVSIDGKDTMLLHNIFDILSKVFRVVWSIQAKAKLSSNCAETIKSLSRAIRAVPCFFERFAEQSPTRREFLSGAVHQMSMPVSSICGVSDLPLSSETNMSLNDVNVLPSCSSWMSPTLKQIAMRCFNLCIATNVTYFSGWEAEEFSIRLMRKGLGPNFMGISMKGSKVTGTLSVEVEDSLLVQWRLVQNLASSSFTSQIEATLRETLDSSSYKESKKKLSIASKQHPISCNGEDAALCLLVSFSHTCLLWAVETSENSVQTSLFCLSLSILIPVTEFCVGIAIWDAEIGGSALSVQTGLNEWRNFDWTGDDVAPSNRPGYLRPSKRGNSVSSGGARSLHERFEFENDHDLLSNMICLPISVLQVEWKNCNECQDHKFGEIGLDSMEKVNQCVRQLRQCYSEAASEKASLNTAVALIQVASTKECQNRFLCIQQAARFASQAPKGGTSDRPFQSALPKHENCTTLEALLVIARADCLQAVHFCQEAAFLCSYVLSVCKHRYLHNGENWNSRWRIISIMAYDLSVVIRKTASLIVKDKEKLEEISGTWDKEIIAELERARLDGLNWSHLLERDKPTNNHSIHTTTITDYYKYESSGFTSCLDYEHNVATRVKNDDSRNEIGLGNETINAKSSNADDNFVISDLAEV